MEFRSSPREGGRAAEVVVSGPDGAVLADVALLGGRVTVGRLPGVNDIALEPDPELLVTRAGHCTFELEGSQWFVLDGGSVNGTFVRRGGALQRVSGRAVLHDGDVVCVLASVAQMGERRYFELAFQSTEDSQATRAVLADESPAGSCLSYDTGEARLVLVQGGDRHEIPIRAQAHRLVRYMVERNAAGGGGPALCPHDEMMRAGWGGEPVPTREELAQLGWEPRQKLGTVTARHFIENERRAGH